VTLALGTRNSYALVISEVGFHMAHRPSHCNIAPSQLGLTFGELHSQSNVTHILSSDTALVSKIKAPQAKHKLTLLKDISFKILKSPVRKSNI